MSSSSSSSSSDSSNSSSSSTTSSSTTPGAPEVLENDRPQQRVLPKLEPYSDLWWKAVGLLNVVVAHRKGEDSKGSGKGKGKDSKGGKRQGPY